MAEFFRGNNSLIIHKCIKKTNQSASLTRKVLQVEKVKSSKSWCPHRHLNICLITYCAQSTGGHEKILSLIAQVIFFKPFPENLQIPRFHDPGIFIYLIKIRIDLVLANLCTHSWNIAL